MTKRGDPVIIELDASEAFADPAEAPPVPDEARPEGRAMRHVIALGNRRSSRLSRWFWRLSGAFIAYLVSVWVWDRITALILANTLLGWVAVALGAALAIVTLAIAIREAAAFARLKRLDRLQNLAATALADQNLAGAQQVVGELQRLYANRSDLKWGRARLGEQARDVFDADRHLEIAEAELIVPLDQAAVQRIEVASRLVAAATALIPLALADVAVALAANLRMIRAIAEIYGGQSGTLGNWRLARNVMAHLVATGAVAIGDDLISSVAGGGVLSKLSRRFGEGVINGALTARVGIAAIEVCRPLPYVAAKKPSVRGIMGRAMVGLFGKSGQTS